MAHYVIVSRENKRWRCRLADCDKQHAKSVLAQLEADPAVPNNLKVKRVWWWSRG